MQKHYCYNNCALLSISFSVLVIRISIITDLNDKDSAEVALIENVQRKDLTPIEEAISYKKEIITKTVVKNYLENTDDILARIIQHPTVTNAKIIDDTLQLSALAHSDGTSH